MVNVDTVKQNIMDWFKEDSISFTDISEKNPNFIWILQVSKSPSVLVFKIPQFPNRIYFRTITTLRPEHVKLFSEDETKKNNLTFKIHTLTIQLDVNPTFSNNDKKQLSEIWINKIYYNSTIKKADLLEKFTRIQHCQNVILNHVNRELKASMQIQTLAPDASDVGIQ